MADGQPSPGAAPLPPYPPYAPYAPFPPFPPYPPYPPVVIQSCCCQGSHGGSHAGQPGPTYVQTAPGPGTGGPANTGPDGGATTGGAGQPGGTTGTGGKRQPYFNPLDPLGSLISLFGG